jgi:ABC-type Co2+ transport system permease subunit
MYIRIHIYTQKYKYMDPTSDIMSRVVKYLVEGLFVALAAVFIPKRSLPVEEILSLGLVAAAVFAILDVVSPSIGATARQGAGFGLGANLVGFPMR